MEARRGEARRSEWIWLGGARLVRSGGAGIDESMRAIWKEGRQVRGRGRIQGRRTR